MILITGATGQVGREAVNALVAAGAAVRVFVRNPSSTSTLQGVQVVQGSFDDDESLSRALDGIDTMLLAGRDSPDTVSQHRPECNEPLAAYDYLSTVLAGYSMAAFRVPGSAATYKADC